MSFLVNIISEFCWLLIKPLPSLTALTFRTTIIITIVIIITAGISISTRWQSKIITYKKQTNIRYYFPNKEIS